MILIKMIERELDTPVYFLIKDLRNGLTVPIGAPWALFSGTTSRRATTKVVGLHPRRRITGYGHLV